MAASANIKFDQGPNSDIAGRAVVGTIADGLVTVSNGNDAGVVNWTFTVLYVPPGSGVGLTTQGPGVTATFTFTPDVPGTYRIQLKTDGLVPATDTDLDIRCFCVPFTNGVIAPPYQRNPAPLGLTGAGGKADEMNVGGQLFGWDGEETGNPILLYQVLEIVDGLTAGAGGEINLGANVGGSGEDIFRDKTGVTLNFKRLIAGANVTLTPAADTLTIATAGVGEANTASNEGGGQYNIFIQKTGINLEFKTISEGTGIEIGDAGNVLTINSTIEDGEINTASNVGTGQGVFKQKTTFDLEFHRLISANANLVIGLNGDDIEFTVPASGSGRSAPALTIPSPHTVESNVASIYSPRDSRKVVELVCQAATDTFATGGSFAWEVFHAVATDTAMTSIGTVTMTQGTQRATSGAISVTVPANVIFVVDTTAIGSFPVATNVRRKKFFMHVRMENP